MQSTAKIIPEAKFSLWLGDIADFGIGLLYRPARLHRLAGGYDNYLPDSTLSPSQGLRIWLLDIPQTAIDTCILCFSPPIAKEVSVTIQYKCLVPIYVFPELKLLSLKQNYNVLSPSSFSQRFIYFQDGSAYSAAGKYVDRSWEYINRSQTHECGNWDWGPTIPRKGIHKWDFFCSADYKST